MQTHNSKTAKQQRLYMQYIDSLITFNVLFQGHNPIYYIVNPVQCLLNRDL